MLLERTTHERRTRVACKRSTTSTKISTHPSTAPTQASQGYTQVMAEWLTFPADQAAKLEPWLPPKTRLSSEGGGGGGGVAPGEQQRNEPAPARARPFVTLTFATSLDSALSLAPGVRTTLSGPQSKAMTHFLRSRHDAILIGAGTAVADDPGLNCRIQDAESQPRPIVVDPRCRWSFHERSKVLQLAGEGRGLAPFVITTPEAAAAIDEQKRALLESHGGKYISLKYGGSSDDGVLDWNDILAALQHEGLNSVMVEGGGHVINTLLGHKDKNDLVDSVIITIAPTWLGQGGVVVSPAREVDESGNPKAALRLTNLSWHPLGDDVVLCGQIEP
ncbi:riboflavin biosynthesis protein Rib7 [Pyricularia oryzae 70-15]|uniref:2,5-diamino-6-ribosylamino-4(3H)-pyrimidinone 5'-phosphate reductase n=3 Tax=Pyricularia oryzae TaxID=318829 RepID=G4NIN7_PYRO7|nr:riboflavin biosynthesis protein Rib7 [Pyricularia oryzae 70-15]EHA47293.1 riboflavin biosynthesis protein Rib7 [Pyricularia oryzae 70-15]